MSGLVGADNEFGKQFGHPDETMQGIRMISTILRMAVSRCTNMML